MQSTAEDRLAVVYQAYAIARDEQESDIAAATSDQQADAIRAHVNTLELIYLRAEREQLDAGGPAVEAAYQAAKAAADAATRAYQRGAALADRIRAIAGAATAVASLVATATTVA
jgi:hypothetical protein